MKCVSSFLLSFCIGDGDGKQEEVEEDVLQQQDWQKSGHPHGPAGCAGGSHWSRCKEKVTWPEASCNLEVGAPDPSGSYPSKEGRSKAQPNS